MASEGFPELPAARDPGQATGCEPQALRNTSGPGDRRMGRVQKSEPSRQEELCGPHVGIWRLSRGPAVLGRVPFKLPFSPGSLVMGIVLRG